jgi:phosphoribosylformylglycinamidine synthase subunit PurL
VRLGEQGLPPEFLLFGEDASRVVVSCDPAHLARVREMAAEYEIHADVLGETAGERVEIAMDGQSLISASVAELRDAHEGSLARALRTESGVASP